MTKIVIESTDDGTLTVIVDDHPAITLDEWTIDAKKTFEADADSSGGSFDLALTGDVIRPGGK